MPFTSYVVLNSEVSDGQGNSIFFEGSRRMLNSERKKYKRMLTPLSQAKLWARANGYTHLTLVSLKMNKKDKHYVL